MKRSLLTTICIAALTMLVTSTPTRASSGPDTTLQHYTGVTQNACICFVPGEEAGAVFIAPAAHYPIEILRVGIGWGSQLGTSPQVLEQGIHIYANTLSPAGRIFTLPGPVMTDGVINDFNLEPLAGQIIVPSDSFTVSLEFLNQNAGQIFAPSMVSDGNGCAVGLNVIKAIPGGWSDACLAGLTGDWVMYVVYRACNATVGVGEPQIAASQPAILMPARPNPFVGSTSLEFFIAESGPVTIGVYDVAGRRVSLLADSYYSAGAHPISWNGQSDDGSRLNPGAYFVRLEAGDHRSLRKVFLNE